MRIFFVSNPSNPDKVLEVIKKIAQENRTRDVLRIWWCNKYQIPPTDERFLNYSIPELLVEFYEDFLEKKEELERLKVEHPDLVSSIEPSIVEKEIKVKEMDIEGQKIKYLETGDPFIDELERKVAEERVKYIKEKKQKKEKIEDTIITTKKDEFVVDFTKPNADKLLSIDLIQALIKNRNK